MDYVKIHARLCTIEKYQIPAVETDTLEHQNKTRNTMSLAGLLTRFIFPRSRKLIS